MTKDELLSCLTDRPCGVCKFHTDLGCSKWTCAFEGKTEEWIPCEERLPEPNVEVIVTNIVRHTGDISVGTNSIPDPPIKTHYEGFKWHIIMREYPDGLGLLEPIAWMPLPKPYEGRTE